MKPPRTSVLVVDDEAALLREVNEFLTSCNLKVYKAATPSEAFRILSAHAIDIALLDIRLPEMSGMEVLGIVRRSYPETSVIMMSGHGDMDTVIQSLRAGAIDYFRKPFHLQEVLETIEKTTRMISNSRQVSQDHFDHLLDLSFGQDAKFPLIAESAPMKAVVEKMRLVARSKDTTVLITGESGTGKELVARGIHYLSCRKDSPFYPVNCSSVPDELFESEFFGYRRGAFTGAVADKTGWFEAADQGTLFLDEIGDLKVTLQSKLLRIMDDKKVGRLGSTQVKKVDVRVIAATNQDLLKLMAAGRFRQDLYHRLNTFVIHVPALRERIVGIPLLFDHYLAYYSGKLDRPVPKVKPGIIDALMRYDFPGNVRELKHMIERALILCQGNTLTMDHFDQLKLKMSAVASQAPALPITRPLHSTEKETIEAALAESGNNKSQAARLLGLSRQALDRKIAKLGIEGTESHRD